MNLARSNISSARVLRGSVDPGSPPRRIRLMELQSGAAASSQPELLLLLRDHRLLRDDECCISWERSPIESAFEKISPT
ncbi:unnamed protein product [Pleuronectes platessa]|uniref:Uncharacterized protein n=1 Tax=Pleuronectes platessa TaxID=8262 RepID=A0A9N7U5Y1_PLEPL|nr:unnamed protein product [Pleuronectes platessa]